MAAIQSATAEIRWRKKNKRHDEIIMSAPHLLRRAALMNANTHYTVNIWTACIFQLLLSNMHC